MQTRTLGATDESLSARGLLSGKWTKERTQQGQDYRAHLPRFQDENLEKNLRLVDRLQEIADEKDSTVSQLAIAGVLAQGEDIIPLVGARKRHPLRESLGALTV